MNMFIDAKVEIGDFNIKKTIVLGLFYLVFDSIYSGKHNNSFDILVWKL